MSTSAIRREVTNVFEWRELMDTTDVLPTREDIIETATDRIIQIIREAMLTPATVKAAHRGVPPPVQIERVITTAQNEVFGE